MHQRGVARTGHDVRTVTGTSKSQLYHYFAEKSVLVGTVIQQQVPQPQQPELDGVDSMAALSRWRGRVVAMNRQVGPLGRCPLGRLVVELAEADGSAPAELAGGFATWAHRLAIGLKSHARTR